MVGLLGYRYVLCRQIGRLRYPNGDERYGRHEHGRWRNGTVYVEAAETDPHFKYWKEIYVDDQNYRKAIKTSVGHFLIDTLCHTYL